MRVTVRVAEAIAVLVPDFLTLGVVVPAFFSLYRCALSIGLPGTRDMNVTLWIFFVLAYVVAVTFNLANAVTLPARPSPVSISHRERRKRELSRASRSEAVTAESVCKGGEISEETGFLREVQE